MIDTPRKQHGFTLVELAITLLILSLFLVAVIGLYQKSEQQDRVRVTNQRMQMIVQALSSHAETAGRLPCPARPEINDTTFGWEAGITAADLTVDAGVRPFGSCTNTSNIPANNDTTGIVPFLSLNLPPQAIRDGWGNYFTYAVSPVFTQDNDRNNAGVMTEADTNVHARCRTAAWTSIADTISSFKSRFCCAAQVVAPATQFPRGTDLSIQLTTDPGTAISPVRVDFTVDNLNGYDSINTLAVNAADSAPDRPTTNITAPAFVLVSHGENGEGSFLANGTRTRKTSGGLVGANETENNNFNRLYFTGPRNLSGTAADYFDDIVIWMTQDGIMAANGTSSCQYP
ncbi:MAG: type II secretion system GspH family protein [Alphaproteobacteria bacterium]|nr:type II secretion system GspH family protein [Alphaproteobacteria bacterium]